MDDLLWPGDTRAGGHLDDAAVVRAMVRVEQAWLDALVGAGLAPAEAAASLEALVGDDGASWIAAETEASGNPVVPLVALLSERADGPTSTWLHRGLTSQDVLDTGLVLVLAGALDTVAAALRQGAAELAALADRHRDTLVVGRTLTQPALPTTFGLVVCGWLDGVLDAIDDVDRVRTDLPAQVGGAVGTLAGTTELARLRRLDHPAEAARDVARRTAETLALRARTPWHVSRATTTRVADALVGAVDACGHLATDVLTGSRPEVGELTEPAAAGRGGSSTMPQKQNPVLAVLVRRAALEAPGLAATVHLAAATAGDQRPAGAWHAEWSPLRTLARHAVVATSQTAEIARGLGVDTDRMSANLQAALPGVLAERDAVRALVDTVPGLDAAPVGDDPADYLGAAHLFVAETLARADHLEGHR